MSEAKHHKPKAVDLGALQSAYEKAKAEHIAATKALGRAQEAHDAAGAKYASARDALSGAFRTVVAS